MKTGSHSLSKASSLLAQIYETTATKPSFDTLFVVALLALEAVLGLVIIARVPYTEIDWEAYMQEVSMWLDDGQLDYRKIYGGTGPLVYPAGFLYLFATLRRWTDMGQNIHQGQLFFLGFYLVTLATVIALYQNRISVIRGSESSSPREKAHQIWSWRVAIGVLCLSKRMHSIFMLRLFNDGTTMMLLYVSMLLFTKQRWNLGCVVFSLAVSVKMNVLLFAPGLLLLLLQTGPDLKTVFYRLMLGCALPQLILGAPFLTTHPVSYLRKAFELDRVFFYKWTVNLKFLPEDIFLAKPLSIALLVLHLGGLAVCAFRWLAATKETCGSRLFLNRPLSRHYIVYTMFVSNFIGIAFARTLHYQFYVRRC